MKSLLKTMLLMVPGILAAIVSGELFIRLLSPQRLDNNLACFEPDSMLVFSMQEGYRTIHSSFEFSVPVEINSLGLRDRELQPKSSHVTRIVGLGDSFTFGNGVTIEQTFLKRLEACISTPSDPVEVINCGVPAYGPLQEHRFLNKYRSRLQPNIVLLAFFVGNDFNESSDLYDNMGNPTLRVVDGNLVSILSGEREHSVIRRVTQPLRAFLSTSSHLYIFLRDRSSQLLSRFGLRPFNLPPDFCRREFSERMQRNWEYTQTILQHAAQQTAEHNERFIVLILPTSYQVYQATWDEYIAALQLDPREYDLEKPQRLLKEFFSHHGIEWVDALPVLRNKIIGPPLFFSVDGHLTPEGHAIVGQALCEYLKSTSAKRTDTGREMRSEARKRTSALATSMGFGHQSTTDTRQSSVR